MSGDEGDCGRKAPVIKEECSEHQGLAACFQEFALKDRCHAVLLPGYRVCSSCTSVDLDIASRILGASLR